MMYQHKTLGIMFLGGLGLRLGGVDKSEIMIGSETCFDRIYRALSHGTSKVALSRPYGGSYTVADVIPDWPRTQSQSTPALALLGCLSFAANNGYDQILTSSIDTPFLPHSFGQRLASDSLSAVARSGQHLHGLHARWSCALLPGLKTRILNGEHGISRLHEAMGSDIINFEADPVDPFFNINLPDDLVAAQSLALEYHL